MVLSVQPELFGQFISKSRVEDMQQSVRICRHGNCVLALWMKHDGEAAIRIHGAILICGP